MYYELHITIESPPSPLTKPHVVNVLGWKYSEFDGDPVLGNGKRSYATTSFGANQHLPFVMSQLDAAVTKLNALGETVTRSKIELVMVDNHFKMGA
jgi:hypothetical protein